MAARVMGKLAFLKLMDDTGSIQVILESYSPKLVYLDIAENALN